MKKLLIIAGFLCSAAAFAQNGFYLQPEIGVGASNISPTPKYPVDIYHFPWGLYFWTR